MRGIGGRVAKGGMFGRYGEMWGDLGDGNHLHARESGEGGVGVDTDEDVVEYGL